MDGEVHQKGMGTLSALLEYFISALCYCMGAMFVLYVDCMGSVRVNSAVRQIIRKSCLLESSVIGTSSGNISLR